MKLHEVEIGLNYAYRENRSRPLRQVTCLAIDSVRSRVRIRFAEDSGGVEEVVPAGRLCVAWADRDAFVEDECCWATVCAASLEDGTAEMEAAHVVFDRFVDPKIAQCGYSKRAGVITIHDVSALAGLLNLAPSELERDPLTFNSGGSVVASWQTTELVVRALCRLNVNLILDWVEAERGRALRELVDGDLPVDSSYIQDQQQREMWTILSSWCAGPTADQRDELIALRGLARELGRFGLKAIEVVGNHGRRAESEELRKEFQRILG